MADIDSAPERGRSGSIAVIMPMEPTFYTAALVLRGIRRHLKQANSSRRLVYLASAITRTTGYVRPIVDGELSCLQQVLRERMAGVILWYAGDDDATLPVVERLRADGVPVVFIDRCPGSAGPPRYDFVGSQNREAACAAVEYLIAHGHRRIAHINLRGNVIDDMVSTVRERFEGYRDALEKHGITFDDRLIYGSPTDLLAEVRSESGEPPTAAFVVNDWKARQLIEAAVESGLRVPGDISVVGFDNVDSFYYPETTLTTVDISFQSIGEHAAELLLARLTEADGMESPARHIRLPGRLVERHSVADANPANQWHDRRLPL